MTQPAQTDTDRIGPFDITVPGTVMLPEQRLSQTGSHQNVAVDDAHGLMYSTQIINGGRMWPPETAPKTQAQRALDGDLAITRMTMDGAITGVMYVRGAGHGVSLTCEPVGADTFLWMEADSQEDGVFGLGTKVGRVKFVDQAVVDQPAVEKFDPVPGFRRVFNSVDFHTNRIMVSWADLTPERNRVYRVYNLDDFKAHNYRVLYQWPIVGLPADRSLQNHVLFGNYVYQLTGHNYSGTNPPPGDSYISVTDIRNGRLLERVFNDTALELNNREPEALNIWWAPDGPRLFQGFSTNAPAPFRMVALYFWKLRPPAPRPKLPSPPPAVGILGCATEYQAAIFYRRGERIFLPASTLGVNLVAVRWERRLNETSTAQIVVAKRQLDSDCCGALGLVEPWCHELAIYRGDALVWQGPILRVAEEEDQVLIDAADITAWLGKLVNTHPTVFRTTSPQAIAQQIIRTNLLDVALATPERDWPNLLPFMIVTIPPGPVLYPVTILRGKSFWTDTVLDILKYLAGLGFEWTVIGRALILRPRVDAATSRPRARLVPDHLPGGITIVRDGEDAATRSFVTSQTESAAGITVSKAVTKSKAVCGRLDMLIKNNPRIESDDPAEVERETRRTLTAAAVAALSGRWPSPLSISVQPGTRLSPEAPLTIDDLYPGERVDVAAVGFCRPVTAAMKLAGVAGVWSQAGEEVRVTLTPMNPLES